MVCAFRYPSTLVKAVISKEFVIESRCHLYRALSYTYLFSENPCTRCLARKAQNSHDSSVADRSVKHPLKSPVEGCFIDWPNSLLQPSHSVVAVSLDVCISATVSGHQLNAELKRIQRHLLRKGLTTERMVEFEYGIHACRDYFRS
jgi:hypothetical protein